MDRRVVKPRVFRFPSSVRLPGKKKTQANKSKNAACRMRDFRCERPLYRSSDVVSLEEKAHEATRMHLTVVTEPQKSLAIPAAAPPATVPATAQKKPRMAWPDVAKGLSIIGVVLLHICLSVPDGMYTAAAQVNELIAPLRMPLFFLVSGFFSIKVFRFSFAELFVHRLWFLLVPYVLWTPLELFAKRIEFFVFWDEPLPDQDFYVEALWTSENMYWFLHSLFFFTIALWSTKFLHLWLRWFIPLAIIVCAPIAPETPMTEKVVAYLPCFLIGAYARPLIERYAENALKPVELAVACGTRLLSREISHVSVSEVWELSLLTLTHLLYLPAAIVCAVLLSKVSLVGEGLQWIGRHTLVIYLSHPIVLTLLFGYFFRYREEGIELYSDTLLGSSEVWVLLCIGFTIAGAAAMELLSRLPLIGRSIAPRGLVPRQAGVAKQTPVAAKT
ncbi:acyltransferase family protein [Corynebacterium silvaticum]|nr:acyltransferase family protein [Corynebacterium silvaticum]UWG99701.1 acyltransferase family protein [Corynebacterium silvaticum]UWH01748.1 acyltransferase family protein [Corynebacterium silvaticum]UWH03785.1 acyltransferase family protein [Corynebacterium silvaticum]UXZ25947.1 acyltransferase family protein [Corynebacterium silvaticum]UXZ27980.1 acyltransferase family protein [Corynebacterium silvaticum]